MPNIRISEIGRQGVSICGVVCCDEKQAYFRWDKSTEELRLFTRTRFFKKEVPPAEEFFIHKDAIIAAIVPEVESFITAEAQAMVQSLEELILEAGGLPGEGLTPDITE